MWSYKILKSLRQLSLLLISLFILTNDALAQKSDNTKNLKKLYIANIKAKNVPITLADRLRNGIMLGILEEYAGKYRVIDDEAIRVMYSQAASIMASGGVDDSCVIQIADGINADEIVYGDISRNGIKVEINIKCIERKGETVSTKSMVKISFYESQLDYVASETSKKIVDPAYKIVLAETIDEQKNIELGGIEIKSIDNLDISVIQFKSKDETVSKIIDYLKSLVSVGDAYFKKQEYVKAREKYFEIIDKVNTKLSAEKQLEVKDYVKGIIKRINSTYIMQYKPDIERIDTRFNKTKNSDLINFENGLKEYSQIEAEVIKISSPYNASRDELLTAINDRMDSLKIAICAGLEKKADTYYKDYLFSDAMTWYNKASVMVSNVKNNVKKNKSDSIINKKINTTRDTGRSFLFNRVKSLVDQAEFYNFQDNRSKAKKLMEEARVLITDSSQIFVTNTTLTTFNRFANVLGINEIITDVEKEKLYLKKRRERIDDIPDSFDYLSLGSVFINMPIMGGWTFLDADKMWLSPNRVIGIGLGISLVKVWYSKEAFNYEEGTSSGSFNNKKDSTAVGVWPLRIEIPFYFYKFYNYSGYLSLFAESPLWCSIPSSSGNTSLFDPIEFGFKIFINSKSLKTILLPLEIRCGYMICRNSENKTPTAANSNIYRYNGYSTFYIGAVFHLGGTLR